MSSGAVYFNKVTNIAALASGVPVQIVGDWRQESARFLMIWEWTGAGNVYVLDQSNAGGATDARRKFSNFPGWVDIRNWADLYIVSDAALTNVKLEIMEDSSVRRRKQRTCA
jgi:hypothetical protein